METPEKLYLVDDDEVLDLFPVLCLASTEKHSNDIEYIRKDVFIEKAAKWINEHTNLSEKLVIEDFKKHMKGE